MCTECIVVVVCPRMYIYLDWLEKTHTIGEKSDNPLVRLRGRTIGSANVSNPRNCIIFGAWARDTKNVFRIFESNYNNEYIFFRSMIKIYGF